MSAAASTTRPRIALLEYADVFEDFYPHYGIDQREFATRWHGSGNHALARVLQRELGDVTWYELSIAPRFPGTVHEWTGAAVKLLQSSWAHRWLWRLFYLPRAAWRWRRLYPGFALLASYLATWSWSLLRELRRDRPDVIFVQDYANGRFDVLLLVARLLGVPLVAYHSGSRPDFYVGAWLKKWTLRRADCLIVSSGREREMLKARYAVASERIHVILTPIEIETFRPQARDTACAVAGLDPSRRHVLFVGRLDDRIKRVGLLIDCFARIAPRFPDAELVIVGDGHDGPRLRERAARTPALPVRFAGWVADDARLAAHYCAAECLVLISRSEGFPGVVGEAMACGTPVVATDVGGVAELVVAAETGWLLPASDDDAVAAGLVAALEQILANPGAIAPLRARARRMAELRVSPARVAAQLAACFRILR